MGFDEEPPEPEGPRTVTQEVPIFDSAVRTRVTLTVTSGPEAGKVHSIGPETLIGRGPHCNVQIDDPGVSRTHARLVLQGDSWVLSDMQSRNGVVVGTERILTRRLVPGDLIRIGPHVRLRFAMMDEEEERYARALYESSLRDPLTGAFNRRHMEERLSGEIAFAVRHGTDLAVAMFDVDHFKRVNDSYGHQAGDQVLKTICTVVAQTIRAEDLLCRYGGEEFVVVARGIDVWGAMAMAERIRKVVEAAVTSCGGRLIRATISVGAAALSECGDRRVAGGLTALADRRLYQAKQAGRNRVVGPC